MDVRKKIAMSIYIGLGGDPKRQFDTADDIYNEIDKISAESGSRIAIEPLSLDITENGVYTYDDNDITGYKPVEVNVNVDVGNAYDDGYNTGYNIGVNDGVDTQKAKLIDIDIVKNGVYESEDGYKKVNVEVPASFDFSTIGYDDAFADAINAELQADIDYSIELYNNYGGVLSGSAYQKFNNNIKLKYCPAFDTSTVTTMNRMFVGCSKLSCVPEFDLSKCTDVSYMFMNCISLTDAPFLDLSKCKSMYGMFYYCSSLTSVPLFDTSNITDMTDAFKYSGVTEIPAFNTSNVTSMYQTFEAGKIVTVPDMYWGKVNKVGWTFPGTLVNLGVLQDFGKEPTITGTNSTFISSGTKLTKQSMLNLVNGLYDRASAGYSVLTLKVQTNNINLLTDEEIAIATNKGWILS